MKCGRKWGEKQKRNSERWWWMEKVRSWEKESITEWMSLEKWKWREKWRKKKNKRKTEAEEVKSNIITGKLVLRHRSGVDVVSACGPWTLLAAHYKRGGVSLTKRPNEDKTLCACVHTCRAHIYVCNSNPVFMGSSKKSPVILKTAQAVT